jgi:hypothetical protein
MPINKAKALRLKASLLERHALSDFHSLPRHCLVQEIVHDAGLATAFIPMMERHKKDHSTAKWRMHLAVVDPGNSDVCFWWDRLEAIDPAYALIELKPMTDYLGTLDTCNLSSLWWAATGAFFDLADLLAPDWRKAHDLIEAKDPNAGRSHWGDQYRRAFAQAFDDHWADDSLVLRPTVKADKQLLRYCTAPRSNPPATAASES